MVFTYLYRYLYANNGNFYIKLKNKLPATRIKRVRKNFTPIPIPSIMIEPARTSFMYRVRKYLQVNDNRIDKLPRIFLP